MIDSNAVIGLDLRVLWDERDTLEPWLAPLVPLLDARVIRRIVSEVVPFADAARANQILTGRQNVGKVLLVPEQS
ncbi:hypothetical protein [Amycolatopsis pithecellobii]|uniref:Zinc-binding dehydrogenase n=1 Tax=Amycolatopsis pithecellobii TaxID=664692 RepID=A0A6N7YS18_9PSEU|nr:hypothetical protein [Amycolatopsis pithecellobii]MTD54728.1 hypothetical protein [Amycolatopsis pithecellobii]